MKNSVRMFSVLILGFGILVSFQNCAPLAPGEQSMSLESLSDDLDSQFIAYTGVACEDELMNTFKNGFHRFLQSNCAGCHNGKDPEIPGFAQANIPAAFEVFQTKTYQTVAARALSSHQSVTGPQNKPVIDPLTTEYAAAMSKHAACSGTAPVANDFLLTISKTDATNLNANKDIPANWVTLSWDLETQVDSTSVAKVPATVTIEAQVAKINGSYVGYAFRKPKFKLKAAGTAYAVQLSEMYFTVNGVFQPNATTYRKILVNACTDTAVTIMPTANPELIVLDRININTDKFALKFTAAKKIADKTTVTCTQDGDTGTTPDLPSKVTYAQLTGTDAKLNVFKTSCVSCHNATKNSGGVDLTNYSEAKAKASKVNLQVANGTMPPSGPLDDNKKGIIGVWVNGGALEK